MRLHKLFLGICPAHERSPTVDRDGQGKVFLIGATWKEQLIRTFPPPLSCYIRLEPSTTSKVGAEVVASFDPDDEEHLAWSWRIELEVPDNWDRQSLEVLVRHNWLSSLTR